MGARTHPCVCPVYVCELLHVCECVHVCEFLHTYLRVHRFAFGFVCECLHTNDCVSVSYLICILYTPAVDCFYKPLFWGETFSLPLN